MIKNTTNILQDDVVSGYNLYTNVSTKVCPKCGNKDLVLLRTMNRKCCTSCKISILWEKSEGQQDLVANNRLKNK